MKEKPDLKTQKILSEGEQLSFLVHHESWGLAKRLLNEKIAKLNSLTTLDFSLTPTALANEIKNRASVVLILEQWIAEIEGEANKYMSMTSQSKDDDNIVIYKQDSDRSNESYN